MLQMFMFGSKIIMSGSVLCRELVLSKMNKKPSIHVILIYSVCVGVVRKSRTKLKS